MFTSNLCSKCSPAFLELGLSGFLPLLATIYGSSELVAFLIFCFKSLNVRGVYNNVKILGSFFAVK